MKIAGRDASTNIVDRRSDAAPVARSFEFDGREVLLNVARPDGTIMSDDEAIQKYLADHETLNPRTDQQQLTAAPAAAPARSDAARLPYGAPVDAVPATIAGGAATGPEIFAAAAEQMRFVDNSNAAYIALEEAYNRRTQAIKDRLGIDLGNPLSYTAAEALPQGGNVAVLADHQQAYQARLEELAKTASPDDREIIGASRPVQADAEAIARESDARLAQLMASNPSWPAGAASLLGSMAGGLRDPVTIGSLFIGGGSGGARTAVWRILQTAAREAFVNGATTAVTQPAVQDWRRRAGLPGGFDQAAQNVLLAAALGGGLGGLAGGAHEVVSVLGRARPALPAEARGALDRAQQLAATDSLRPDGVSQKTFERRQMYADIAAQGRDVPVSPDAPDEVDVNRIVASLAPAPESVTLPADHRGAGWADRLIDEVASPAKAAMAAPTPILDHIRALGGVDPKSPVADELRHAGVTAKSIYRKGGLTALDNLPHAELPESVRHSIADDGNGYASEDALVQAAGGEASSYGAGRTVEDAASIRDYYERQGVDFSAPRETVREQLIAADNAERRYNAPTDEVTAVPDGFTRRQHTEQLVRSALKLQPGLPANLVRDAVNLSLFERVPIEEAVSDVMSDAAGVPRVAEEQAAIARAYDQVRAQPSGPLDDPLVKIEPADIEGTILERGAFRDINEVEFNRRGFGLVKVIWRHGEASDLPEGLRVRKSDVLALPRIVRDFEPSAGGPAGRGREWRVRREGRTLVYADTRFDDGQRHVVTIHVEDPGRGGGALSKRRTSQPVSPGVVTAREDTAAGISSADRGAAGRPDGNIAFDQLGSEPPPLLPERAAGAEGEAPQIDFTRELEAMKELGFGEGVMLPIGDELMSLEALQQHLKDTAWLESVVEACKA